MPGTSDPADPECVAAAESTARLLAAAGHHVERAYPAAFDETERMTAFIPIWSAMAAANMLAIGRRIGRDVTPDDVEPLTWFLAERGRGTTGGELLDALQRHGRVLPPVHPVVGRRLGPPAHADARRAAAGARRAPDARRSRRPGSPAAAPSRPFTPVANQTGQPAISLPVAQSASGLPVGAHFIAAPGREDLLLQVAGFVERSVDWSHRRAPDACLSRTSVRLGGGQGFYGDTPRAVAGLLEDGIDYLCLEALAELTLAILAKDRARDESLGYTRDLPRYLGAALPAVLDGRTKVITNAGGINPRAAAHAAIETARGARAPRG